MTDKKSPTEHRLGLYHVLFHSFVVFLTRVYLTLFFKLKVYGRENIPEQDHGYIVASNHTSLLDPPVIATALWQGHIRCVSYMAKQELCRTPIRQWLYDGLGVFKVNREKMELSTIRAAKKVLQTPGWLLGIFPEGTRNKTGGLGEIKKGAAFLAQSTRAPILPIGILIGGVNNRRIVAHIGTLIDYQDKSAEALTEELRAAFEALLAQCRQKLE